jgi:hypothetical protein
MAAVLSGTMVVDRVVAQDSSETISNENVEETLSGERLNEFRSRRFSLELVGRQVSSYDSFRAAEGRSWHRWNVLQGGEPVTEERFLSEAGYYQYAQEASSFRKDARHNLIAGVFLTLVGGVATYIGYNMEDFLDAQHGPSKGMMGAGITVSGLGIGLSVSNILKSRRQWAPFSRAYEITQEYNRELFHELQQEE